MTDKQPTPPEAVRGGNQSEPILNRKAGVGVKEIPFVPGHPDLSALNTGDILLFNRKCAAMGGPVGWTLCSMAKWSSEYDHVALVHRNPRDGDKPYVLEANFNGVTYIPLEKRLDRPHHNAVAVRPLLLESDQDGTGARQVAGRAHPAPDSGETGAAGHPRLPRRADVEAAIGAFVEEAAGTPYKQALSDFIATLVFPPEKTEAWASQLALARVGDAQITIRNGAPPAAGKRPSPIAGAPAAAVGGPAAEVRAQRRLVQLDALRVKLTEEHSAHLERLATHSSPLVTGRVSDAPARDSTGYFCSELCMTALQRADVAPPTPAPNNYVAHDLTTVAAPTTIDDVRERKTPVLLPGAGLGPEILLTHSGLSRQRAGAARSAGAGGGTPATGKAATSGGTVDAVEAVERMSAAARSAGLTMHELNDAQRMRLRAALVGAGWSAEAAGASLSAFRVAAAGRGERVPTASIGDSFVICPGSALYAACEDRRVGLSACRPLVAKYPPGSPVGMEMPPASVGKTQPATPALTLELAADVFVAPRRLAVAARSGSPSAVLSAGDVALAGETKRPSAVAPDATHSTLQALRPDSLRVSVTPLRRPNAGQRKTMVAADGSVLADLPEEQPVAIPTAGGCAVVTRGSVYDSASRRHFAVGDVIGAETAAAALYGSGALHGGVGAAAQALGLATDTTDPTEMKWPAPRLHRTSDGPAEVEVVPFDEIVRSPTTTLHGVMRSAHVLSGAAGDGGGATPGLEAPSWAVRREYEVFAAACDAQGPTAGPAMTPDALRLFVGFADRRATGVEERGLEPAQAALLNAVLRRQAPVNENAKIGALVSAGHVMPSPVGDDKKEAAVRQRHITAKARAPTDESADGVTFGDWLRFLTAADEIHAGVRGLEALAPRSVWRAKAAAQAGGKYVAPPQMTPAARAAQLQVDAAIVKLLARAFATSDTVSVSNINAALHGAHCTDGRRMEYSGFIYYLNADLPSPTTPSPIAGGSAAQDLELARRSGIGRLDRRVARGQASAELTVDALVAEAARGAIVVPAELRELIATLCAAAVAPGELWPAAAPAGTGSGTGAGMTAAEAGLLARQARRYTPSTETLLGDANDFADRLMSVALAAALGTAAVWPLHLLVLHRQLHGSRGLTSPTPGASLWRATMSVAAWNHPALGALLLRIAIGALAKSMLVIAGAAAISTVFGEDAHPRHDANAIGFGAGLLATMAVGPLDTAAALAVWRHGLGASGIEAAASATGGAVARKSGIDGFIGIIRGMRLRRQFRGAGVGVCLALGYSGWSWLPYYEVAVPTVVDGKYCPSALHGARPTEDGWFSWNAPTAVAWRMGIVGAAAVAHAAIVHPFDTVRRRAMVSDIGMRAALREIARDSESFGLGTGSLAMGRRLYAGFALHLVRCVPSFAVSYTACGMLLTRGSNKQRG